jgi:organic radical activating enzyme
MNEDYSILKERNFVFEKRIESPTGCAAKWYQSTLHLQNGLTQSCYNTPQHPIDLNLIRSSPMALHNTAEKAMQRAEMKNGQRPKGCEYCWRIEDQNTETLSDRKRWNSYLGKDVDASMIRDKAANYMFTPRFLEVSFSNLCNFKCGYCHPKNSSRFYSEIKQYGKYEGVSHDCDVHFLKIYDEDNNPYLNAFWDWWPTLSKSLKTIRLTGGEPLIQKSTVDLIKRLDKDPRPDLDLSINSNLGLPHEMMKEKCELLKGLLDKRAIKKLHFYTSIDTWGNHAEYIRHGLNLDVFMKNSEFFLKTFPGQDLSYMVTFNIFSLPKFKDLLAYWLELKKQFNQGAENRIRIYLNILTEPMLYSYTILPHEIAMPYFDDMIAYAQANFDKTNNVGFNDLVINDLMKVKNDYLKNIVRDEETARKYRREFLAFFKEHDRRRKTDLFDTFPEYLQFFELCK